jgi:hypothetical protein
VRVQWKSRGIGSTVSVQCQSSVIRVIRAIRKHASVIGVPIECQFSVSTVSMQCECGVCTMDWVVRLSQSLPPPSNVYRLNAVSEQCQWSVSGVSVRCQCAVPVQGQCAVSAVSVQ